jgi:hypothetical protein
VRGAPEPEPDQSNGDVDEASWLALAAAAPATAEPEFVPAPQPAPGPEHDTVGPRVDVSTTRRRAVETYCTELCGRQAARVAGDATLAAFAADSDHSDSELLALTRTTAAMHAGEGLPGHCAETPRLLAARDNGELLRRRQRQLDSHIDNCVICQSTELRAARSARMFAAVAGIAPPPEPALGRDRAPLAPVAEPAVAAPANTPPEHHRRRPALLVALGVLIIGAIAAGAVVLANRSTNPPSVKAPQANAPISTTLHVTTPAKRPHHAAAAHAARHHKRVVKRHVAVAKKHHHPAHRAASSSSSSSAAPAAATPVAEAPAAPAPAAADPTPAPTSASSSSGSSSSSSGSTLTQSGSSSNLGAVSAPTSGIGSGGGP